MNLNFDNVPLCKSLAKTVNFCSNAKTSSSMCRAVRSYAAFLEHLKNAKSLTQKSHKAYEKFLAQTKMAGPPQKQLRLGHSFALGSFSQNKYEDKVNGNYC